MREAITLYLEGCGEDRDFERLVLRSLLTLHEGQRQMTSDLDNVKQGIAAVKADTAAILSTEKKAAVDLKALQDRVAAIQGSLGGNSPDLAQAAKDLADIHTDLGTIATDLSTTDTAITGTAQAPAAPSGVVIGSIAPAQPAGAAGAQEMTLTGSGFQPGATVAIDTEGTPVTATVGEIGADGTTLAFTADFGGFVGEATITVTNPDASVSAPFTVDTV